MTHLVGLRRSAIVVIEVIKVNIGYARISFEEDTDVTSVDRQEAMIAEYCAANKLAVKVLRDENYSGYKFERPGFREMERLVDEGKVKTIVVKDLSRIGRHNAHVLLFLEKLKEKNVRLILLSENYDSQRDPDDLIGIKTWFNEFYVKDISRKIKSVFNLKKAKGELLTLPPFGYRFVKGNKSMIEPDPEQAEIVKYIYKLYLGGMGTKLLARKLTEEGVPTGSIFRSKQAAEEGKEYRKDVTAEWSTTIVMRILTNDIYAGVLRVGKTARRTIKGKQEKLPEDQQFVHYDHHEPIISMEDFLRAQEVRTGRDKYKGKRRHEYLFSCKIFCADCGATMSGSNNTKNPMSYECVSYHKYGVKKCGRHLVKESKVTEGLMLYIQEARDKFADELDAIKIEKVKKDNSELLKGEYDRLKREIEVTIRQKIEAAAAGGSVEIYAKIEAEKTKRMKTIEMELATVKHEVRSVKSVLERLDKILEEGLTRSDIEYLIDRIEVDRDKNITYKLKVFS